MRVGVVIVGAGAGTRLGLSVRKAMVPLAGTPLLIRSARAFAGIEEVKEIVLVVHPDDISVLTTGSYGEMLREIGVTKLIPGGARRQDSVLQGIHAVPADVGGILVHDAARPFVSAETIRAIAAALDLHEAVVPCVPVTSTVKKVGGDRKVLATLDRSELRAAQTPQGGRREILVRALTQALADGVEVTDDVQAMERLGVQPFVVDDSPWNFKVTTPFDLRVAELVLEQNRGASA